MGVNGNVYIGRRVGEFADIPATGKVRVPICVSYGVWDGQIQRARIYFLIGGLLGQLGENCELHDVLIL